MTKPFKLIVILLWLGFMGWLVRFELAPEWFTHSLSGYRSLLSDGPLVMDNWMKIEFDGTQVGFSHSRVETVDDDPEAQVRVVNRTVLNLNILGTTQRVLVESLATLDALYHLKKLEFEMITKEYRMKIVADKREGDLFDVVIESKSGKQKTVVNIPEDTIIYSPMLELSLKEMSPGDTMSVKIYEPVSMQSQYVIVRAMEKKMIRHRGEMVEVVVLESDMQGMKATSWVDENGKTLRQETPMGWTMIATTPEEANRLASPAELDPDILGGMAVSYAGAIQNPRTAPYIAFEMIGLALPPEQLESTRQVRMPSREGKLIFNIKRGPDWGEGDIIEEADLSEFLMSSPFVQAEDSRIKDQALKIIGGLEHPFDQVKALYKWVYENIDKNPAMSLPSALDVLLTREGDCNEHTYLFTALARSLKIPTKMQIGLVFNDGAFYYHAWPAVFIESAWYELDPTLGQEQVDATHIALLNGEIANQLQLLSVVGRLNLNVVNEGTPDD